MEYKGEGQNESKERAVFTQCFLLVKIHIDIIIIKVYNITKEFKIENKFY